MALHAFIFPGQGSQAVGMGRDLAASFAPARHVFEEVDEVLKQKLSKLMFEGPSDELTLTENAQPALMAVSLAVLRVLQLEGGISLERKAKLVAGHSLGEYAALAAAESFSVAETARLLKLRGQAMQKAVAPGIGAMAALLGVEFEAAREICRQAEANGEIVSAANDNGGGQVVISGHKTAVERAIDIAKAQGVKRAMLLPVSAPFHCALMAPAADAMAEAFANIPPRTPVVPVVANVTAAPTTDPNTIRDLLVQQVTATVRWRESVLAMTAAGIDSFIEIGAGKVLAGLVKRISPDATTHSIGSPADIEAILKVL
ncbi:ACP S-malonyltransferase [Acidocella sp.]|uniref:ACP S-malonyltransferase n=1 Tax=Acidocella sp. TaxID=50710 RepID=UPI0026255F2B|nr:ACP S-malonyltransferase [Acidocella sp.]